MFIFWVYDHLKLFVFPFLRCKHPLLYLETSIVYLLSMYPLWLLPKLMMMMIIMLLCF